MLVRSLPRLREMGIETQVVCLKSEGPLAEPLREAGFPVTLIKMKSRLDPIGLFHLRKLVKREGIEILHSHMYASNIATNLVGYFLPGVKVVNSYHSQTPFFGEHQRKMIRRTRKKPNRFVAVSEAVKAPLVKVGVSRRRIRIIHNGVEIPDGPAPLEPECPNGPIRLFWGGRFVEQKRVGMLIDLASALKKAEVPFRMTLAGEGPIFERIKARAAERDLAGLVEFPGWQNDIKPLIRASDLYISTSNREGLPNTLLEVCAQSRGFIVTDIPPNREVLGLNDAGLCLGDDVSDWVREIKNHQENPDLIRKRSMSAWERSKDFSVEKTCDRTLELYEEILSLQ